MPDSPEDACKGIIGLAGQYCREYSKGNKNPDNPDPGDNSPGGFVGGAATDVEKFANYLIKRIQELLAPKDAWAPKNADSAIYTPFLWLGQHLAVAIFICVIAVCGLTAWQGTPRLRQMGASTGWTLAAVAGMASVPGIVTLLNQAVSNAFTAAFSLNETTLFGAIKKDLEHGADSQNPVGRLVIIAALTVALGTAGLVFLLRSTGILAFVLMAPLVLASLARGGDMTGVKRWAHRLLGLMFCPFVLLAVSPLVHFVDGALVGDSALLVGVDVLMLRMVFHGIPYVGPRMAGAAQRYVEGRTDNRMVRGLVRAGVPAFEEQENTPRGPRLVPTPARAMTGDGRALLGAYGLRQAPRPGRLTTESAIAQTRRDAARSAQIIAARRQARAAAQPPAPNPSPTRRPGPAGAPAPTTPPTTP
ncbi:hypothetical protein AB0M94_39490 [Streptomyces xanthochromogenes]|uniref:hypothetical protein n=1 Tax=Streptomyces xanthochromogenes TaxID=67384 RepID=UPI003449EF29